MEQAGDYAFPEIIIYSVNLQQCHQWRAESRWNKIADHLAGIADKLKHAGADFGLIATNTMHKVFTEVPAATALPLLPILQPTTAAITKAGISRVGRLGTKFTMAETFYTDELRANGLRPLLPTTGQQEAIHQIIVQELVCGLLTAASKRVYLAIIDELIRQGAQGIILGCPEIPRLIQQPDCLVPGFDTAVLPADAALALAISA